MEEHQLEQFSQPAEPEIPVHRVWPLAHPYIAALIGAGILVVFGLFLIAITSPARISESAPLAWGGAGVIVANNSAAPSVANDAGTLATGPKYDYALPSLQPPAEGQNPEQLTAAEGGTDSSFDFDAFVSFLTGAQKGTATTSGVDQGVSNAYSFIPTGLVSTQVAGQKRTLLQSSLFDYGNEVGSDIQSFELEHPDAAQVLWNHAQDRSDASKIDALTSLAHAMTSLGEALATMQGATADANTVPSQMGSAHTALAASYKLLGAKLLAVAASHTDQEFLAAVDAYDTAVEGFTRNYVAVANLFVSYGVSFSPGDPGSVFTFTSTNGL